MIKVIAIKPPKGFLSPEKYTAALAAGTRKAVYEARDLLVKPAAGWSAKNQPNPAVSYGPNGGSVVIAKRVYIYQDAGTRPHVILPRRRRYLRFVANGRTVFARRVRHPGNAPRFFSRQVASVMRLTYQKHVQDAINAVK